MRTRTHIDGGDPINYLRTTFHRAGAGAASLTGRRFGLLVASSVVATSAIVAAALSNPSSVSPLAALLGRSLAADQTPAASTPAPHGTTPSPGAGGSSASPAGGAPTQAGGPLASTAPISSPEASGPVDEPEKQTTPEAPKETLPEAGPIKHVFVISLVSPGYEAAFGGESQMAYLNEKLRPQGELLSGYSLLDDSPIPNQFAAISGERPSAQTKAGCPEFDACVQPVETTTLADELSAGRFTWGAYMEGMTDAETGKPDSCVYPGAEEPYPPAEGGYTATRNPFVYYHSLLDLGDCSADDQPLTALSADLRKTDATPNYSYIAPTLCNAGSTTECPEGQVGGPAAADAFLSEWAPKILASPAYKADGLLIVTFNQIDPVPSPAGTPPPATPSRQVGTLLVSSLSAPGATNAKPYDPYSMLRSVEDLFGLDHLGSADGAKVGSFTEPLLSGNGGD